MIFTFVLLVILQEDELLSTVITAHWHVMLCKFVSYQAVV